MNSENLNENVTNVEKVEEKKKGGLLKKVALGIGGIVVAGLALVGVDHIATGGKGTKAVVGAGKKAVRSITTKKSESTPPTNTVQQTNGQQNPRYNNGGQRYDRPRQQNRENREYTAQQPKYSENN